MSGTKSQSKKQMNAFVEYLAKLIDDSGLNQSEIAERLEETGKSYQQTYISLIKTGRTKLPIYLVPKIAEILGVDEHELLHRALRTYHPEVAQVLERAEIASSKQLTAAESELLSVWREVRPNTPTLNTGQKERLREAFSNL
ncbi:helix-turn-helix transcriptional regulator [Pseudahrensia aquimaris]|uniref:Helix-turn-helix transcriptional regulator n=1 Tax=Pseudahrensia aquimaris TaxID=744461 RepID=A0ABW3FCK9_9HYPH